MHEGSCLCGAVKFRVEGELPPPDACHCVQCRKQSGHFFASTDVPKAALSVTGSDKVTWFQSSGKIRARLLLAVWLDAVLGAAAPRLDRGRDGGVRRGDGDAVEDAHLHGREGRLLRHRRRLAAARRVSGRSARARCRSARRGGTTVRRGESGRWRSDTALTGCRRRSGGNWTCGRGCCGRWWGTVGVR